MQPTTSHKPKPFTIRSNSGLLGLVISDLIVQSPDSLSLLPIKAIWDTGADRTIITKNVVKKLLLSAKGTAKIHTVNGYVERQIYRLNLGLPNKVGIENTIVCDVEVLSYGCDALIGMDIITLGDFSITNFKGNTCMSFRMPSSHEIDYEKNPNYGMMVN